MLKRPAAEVLLRPGAFVLRVLKAFKTNQGLLLAGAVAYYTLLSLIPLLILMLIVLSHVIDEARLLATLTEYLDFVAPSAGQALVDVLRAVLANRGVIGGVVTVTMVLSSALAFAVVESAMSVIFFHRFTNRPHRKFIASAVLPYTFILSLGVGLLVVTVAAGRLARLATHDPRLSHYLVYLMGAGGEVLLLTAIYHVMPVGRLSWRRALLGGVTATVLWECTRHLLLWYYGSISHVAAVYGSLTTSIVVLISVEIAAIVLLLGAQVIAEYERVLIEATDTTETLAAA